MTISSTSNKKTYTGNGSTTEFAYDFKILDSSHLKVITRLIASPYTELTKTETTHYSISGVGSASGGTVTFVSAPADTLQVILLRETPQTQLTDWIENDPASSQNFEDAVDKAMMSIQDMQETLGRTLKVSKTVTDLTTPEFSEPASARADKLLAFDSDGDELTVTTGRVSSVSISTSTVGVTNGASGSGTGSASFTSSTGALALTLGLPTGNTGMMGGVSMQYSTTTSDADPGAGFIRFNNGSLNSATIMYVDDSDGTTDISAWVQSWDNSNSGSRGFITVAGNPNPSSPLVIYKVTGVVTDASGYTKIPVSYVSGSTSITNNAEVSVSFSPAGDGDFAGLDYTFSTTTTDSDPGSGTLRLNHGTFGSVTAAYIDDSDANSADVSAYLLSFDDSTNVSNRGQLRITKKTAPANYVIFNITGASTDASGYVKLALTHVDSNGSFSNADSIALEFSSSGNIGIPAGLNMTYSTTTSDSDPGTGVIRFNNATLSSASIAYVDDADSAGANIEAYVLSWDDSTTTALRGTITMTKRDNPAIFAIWNITGASTDASGYSKLALTYVTGTGSFSDSDAIVLSFVRTGNQGSDASDVFKTISVAGQDDVVADAATDTLTLAGSGTVAITTNAASDTITFTGTAGSFTAAGDSGSSQAIASGNTLTIAGGTGLSSVASATDTITINGDDASTSAKGIAQFSSSNFSASSGTISIKSAGIDLTDEVTGTLPVANGGTGVTDTLPTDRFTSTGKALVLGF